MAITPKATTAIKVDTVSEKTASAGVTINSSAKFSSTQVLPVSATVDLGSTTTSKHFQYAFVQQIRNLLGALKVRTEAAYSLILGANSVDMVELTSANRVQLRLGHTGFTTGGVPILATAACSTTSSTPVTLCTFDIPTTNCQTAIKINVLSRDNTTGNQAYREHILTCSRAGSGAVTGSTVEYHLTGTNLTAVTQAAASNTISVQLANTSGTNTTYHLATVQILSVSTST